jgi:2-dehydropantoate 2-reductase
MKFILLASNAALTAATRTPIGILRDDPDTNALFARTYAEVAAVGRAKGIAIPDDAVEKTLGFNKAAPPTMMASMAHDLIRGNRIELPWLSGKVVSLGKELGVPTPVHEILYALLKPFVNGKAA